MDDGVVVRAARVEDIPAMARVHVSTWQETYRGIMLDQILDDPGFVDARERFWTAAITDPQHARNTIAVAERAGVVVGIAMAGPPMDEDAGWSTQLYVLYVNAVEHGTGAGAALLDAVIDTSESAAVWVADPNPRAQAFYRKHGFAFDGTTKVEDGVDEVRMIRPAPAAAWVPSAHRGVGRSSG
jgi:L-amino acid N-acyltransferase YncA